jgi:hypothetical protein
MQVQRVTAVCAYPLAMQYRMNNFCSYSLQKFKPNSEVNPLLLAKKKN